MKTELLALCALMTCGAAMSAEPSPAVPEMPAPTPQHQWLEKFVGEWDVVSEVHLAADQEPVRASGTESSRMLGGFWVVGEGSFEMPGMSMKSILTFGYDPEKMAYVGTWIDSVGSQRWEYQGQVDDSGKVLRLTTRGFCPMEGRICNFKSTVEFKSDDRRVFTEKIERQDGSWFTAVVSTYTRRK